MGRLAIDNSKKHPVLVPWCCWRVHRELSSQRRRKEKPIIALEPRAAASAATVELEQPMKVGATQQKTELFSCFDCGEVQEAGPDIDSEEQDEVHALTEKPSG